VAEPPKRRRRRRRGRGRGSRTAPTPEDLARRRFGIAHLHPEQAEAIAAVLAGRDVLAVLPTGFGKSLVYQVAALCRARPTVVVSPLVALMADQERALHRRQVPVVRIDSTVGVKARREALQAIRPEAPLVVLTTPESLDADDLRAALKASPPWMLCVDEAHCISEWGHDFRPAYLRLAAQRTALGDPVGLALTATATPRVRSDIVARLGLHDPLVIAGPPYRPNLRLEVSIAQGDEKTATLGRRIKRMERPAIVYCATTRAVDGIEAALARARIPAAKYHGKMTKADREAAQARFMRPKSRVVMIATSAFGMGIDKPDVRRVEHYQAPGSLEQYVQEAGRAGRDGKPATCELLFDPADLEIQRALQAGSRPGPGQLRKVAHAFAAWAGEGRSVDVAELALSAGVPQTIARSMSAQLEEIGVVHRDDDKRFTVLVSPRALHAATDDLVARLEILRRQDEQHLADVEAYAHTTECRAAFLRRYFGEVDPPRCGVCDRCRTPVTARP
jgi:ATP-dependent DNA helicase RecQ